MTVLDILTFALLVIGIPLLCTWLIARSFFEDKDDDDYVAYDDDDDDYPQHPVYS